MNIKELLKLKPLIEAIERGETIQIYTMNEPNTFNWVDVSDPNIQISINGQLDFRVRPKPREFWLIKQEGFAGRFVSESPPPAIYGGDVIKVREVIE